MMASNNIHLEEKPPAQEDNRAPERTRRSNVDIRRVWFDFTHTTGLHGANKLSGPHHSQFRRVFWSLAMLTMALFLVYNIVLEVTNYYDYPTMTDVQVQILEEMEFPAVTLCNLSPLNSSALKPNPEMDNYLLSISAIPVFAQTINWSSPRYNNAYYNTPQTLAELQSVSMQLDSMFDFCFFHGKSLPCREVFQPVVTDVGICYAFNNNASVVRKTKLTGSNNHLKIYAWVNQEHYTYSTEASAGFKVLFHLPDESPAYDVPEIFASGGFSTQVSLYKTKYTYQPHPYVAFGDRKCLDTKGPNFVNPLRHFQTYTYGHCMIECRARYVQERCNCTILSDPRIGETCTLKQVSVCYLPTRTAFETNVTAEASCGCMKPCQFEIISAQISSAAFPSRKWSQLYKAKGLSLNHSETRDNAVELRIYFNNLMVTSVSQKPGITFETVIGNLGGQMGLCLGASILTLSEVVEFLVFLMAALLKRVSAITLPRKPVPQSHDLHGNDGHRGNGRKTLIPESESEPATFNSTF